MGDRVLVIGYGNTLRKDDGAGPAVAQQVAAWEKENVTARVCHQLTPELAADLAAVELAIFVDARVAATPDIVMQKLHLKSIESGIGHTSNPQSLLAWTQALYHRTPAAYWVLIPAIDFGFGETFSPETTRGIAAATRAIARLLQEFFSHKSSDRNE